MRCTIEFPQCTKQENPRTCLPLVTSFPPSSFRSSRAPPRFPPVRYGDYLIERLDRNYDYRKQPVPA